MTRIARPVFLPIFGILIWVILPWSHRLVLGAEESVSAVQATEGEALLPAENKEDVVQDGEEEGVYRPFAGLPFFFGSPFDLLPDSRQGAVNSQNANAPDHPRGGDLMAPAFSMFDDLVRGILGGLGVSDGQQWVNGRMVGLGNVFESGLFGPATLGPTARTEVKEDEGVCLVLVDLEGLLAKSKVKVTVSLNGMVTIDYSMKEQEGSEDEENKNDRKTDEEDKEAVQVSVVGESYQKDKTAEERQESEGELNVVSNGEGVNENLSNHVDRQALRVNLRQQSRPTYGSPTGGMTGSSLSSSSVFSGSLSPMGRLGREEHVVSQVFSSTSFMLDRRCDASNPSLPRATLDQDERVLKLKFPLNQALQQSQTQSGLSAGTTGSVAPLKPLDESARAARDMAEGHKDDKETAGLKESVKTETKPTPTHGSAVAHANISDTQVDNYGGAAPPILPHLRGDWNSENSAFRKAEEIKPIRQGVSTNSGYLVQLVPSDEF